MNYERRYPPGRTRRPKDGSRNLGAEPKGSLAIAAGLAWAPTSGRLRMDRLKPGLRCFNPRIVQQAMSWS
jgi:hypothetical protein